MIDEIYDKLTEVTKQITWKRGVEAPEYKRGMQPLLRVYKDHERGLTPDVVDLDDALAMVEQYYSEFVHYFEWMGEEPVEYEWGSRKQNIRWNREYKERLKEIEKALHSTDVNFKSIVLDTAINQWHVDTTVIKHLVHSSVKDTSRAASEVHRILKRLGRLKPHPESPEYEEDVE